MKPLLLILSVCLIACLGSCKKLESLNIADKMAADSGSYVIPKGTVSIITPDTTYVFTAPGDQITFTGDANYFNIVCYRDNSTSFNISSTDKAAEGATTNIYEFHLFGLYQNAIQAYSNYTTTNIGTITLNSFNITNAAVKGSFNANIAKGNSGSLGNAPHSTITGTFDLQLKSK